MENEIKKYLFDINESIQTIESFLGEKPNFGLYKTNKMLRRAIEREFEIIGEAMTRIKLPPSVRDRQRHRKIEK
jgi:uncharacterized protein with HEPN domain